MALGRRQTAEVPDNFRGQRGINHYHKAVKSTFRTRNYNRKRKSECGSPDLGEKPESHFYVHTVLFDRMDLDTDGPGPTHKGYPCVHFSRLIKALDNSLLWRDNIFKCVLT